MSTKIHNEVATRRQPSKNRPVRDNNYSTHRDVSLPSRRTRKSTQSALSEARARRQSSKLETLRRKTIRAEKYRK